jgi:hypothetical protein
MASHHRTIHIHPDAPSKPDWGAPCNGCGVCCLAEPCPLGVLLSRRRRGACVALVWDGEATLYRCGVLTRPQAVLEVSIPIWGTWMRVPLRALLRTAGARWIAAGTGCDCSLETVKAL